MNNQISLVLIDPDESSRNALKVALAEIVDVKVLGEESDLSRGMALLKKSSADVVVLSLFPQEESALKCAERISQELPECSLFVTAPQAKPDLIIRAMRAGAREFWVQPFRLEDLQEGLQSARRLRKQAGQSSGRGKVVALFGVKGGVGTTTLASNLAVTTVNRSKKDVLLLDWNFQLGQAALFLNIQPHYTMIDIIEHLHEIDPVLLKNALAKADCGVYFLNGSSRIEEAEAIKTPHVEPVMSLLRALFDYIFVDAPPSFDELNLKLLDEADIILVLSTFDVPAVYNAKRCIELFQRLGYGTDKVHLIMNRYVANEALDADAVERTIGQSIFWRIPNQEYSTLIRSINEGIPLSQSIPKSRLTQSLNDLLDRFNGTMNIPSSIDDDKNKATLLKKLFPAWGN
jgi:pilus assembly protein CpaE